MTIEEKVAWLIKENEELKRSVGRARWLGRLFGGCVAVAAVVTTLAGAAKVENVPNRIPAKAFVLVDDAGMARAQIVVAKSKLVGPNAAAIDIQDMNGITIAQIGDSGNAGPSVQFYTGEKGKESTPRSILSYMGVYLNSPGDGKPLLASVAHRPEKDASASLYLGQSGKNHFPSLSLQRAVDGKTLAADLTVEGKPMLRISDGNNVDTFPAPKK